MGPFTMPWRPNLLALVIIVVGPCAGVAAQESLFGVGRPATPPELRAADTTVGPDGKELPPGSGTAVQGAVVFTQRGCTRCHGPNLVEGPGPELVGDEVTSRTSYYPLRYWQFAPLIFDFIRRAMPYDRPGFLGADETYALTAFLLHRNDIIQEGDVMDAKSLPTVRMPHRSRYVDPPPDWKPGRSRPWVISP